MRGVADWMERIAEWIMAAMLAGMVVLVFGNVVLRYVFHSGIVAAEELARLFFVWLIFIGATIGLRRQQHLGIDFIQARLPARLRRACAIIAHVLMLYALWLFVDGSWTQVMIGTGTYSTVLGFPMALYSAAGFFPAIAMTLIVLANLWKILLGEPEARIPGQPLPETSQSGSIALAEH